MTERASERQLSARTMTRRVCYLIRHLTVKGGRNSRGAWFVRESSRNNYYPEKFSQFTGIVLSEKFARTFVEFSANIPIEKRSGITKKFSCINVTVGAITCYAMSNNADMSVPDYSHTWTWNVKVFPNEMELFISNVIIDSIGIIRFNVFTWKVFPLDFLELRGFVERWNCTTFVTFVWMKEFSDFRKLLNISSTIFYKFVKEIQVWNLFNR